MAEWGRVYELKASATADKVWGCIADLFGRLPGTGFPLPEGRPPDDFLWRDGGGTFRWLQDDKWACFNFSGETGGGKVFLEIIFSKAEQRRGKEGFHLLSYYEKAAEGNLVFCLEFFGLVKKGKLVPNKRTEVNVMEIEYSLGKFSKGDDNLKILFMDSSKDSSEGSLLRRVPALAERLWFTGAEIYTCDELDYMSILEAKNPKLREMKSRLPAKMKRQMDSKQGRKKMVDAYPEFDTLRQMLPPTLKVVLGEREEDQELAPAAMEDDDRLICAVSNKVFDFLRENFEERRKTEFKGFLDNYPEKDWLSIQRRVELRAKDQLRAGQFPEPPESQREDGRTESPPAVLEPDSTAGLARREEQERRVCELEERAAAAEGRNVSLEAETKRLQEENGRLEGENKTLRQKNSDLQNQLNRKDAALTRRQNEGRQCVVRLEVPCGEGNLFPDEIEDWLYAVLYSAIEQENKKLPESSRTEVSRRRDVISAILNDKVFEWKNSKTSRKLTNMEKFFKDDSSPSAAGFTKISENEHEKYYFVKERYQVTFALSPSDIRGGQNKMTEIKTRIFLMPPGAADSGASADS